MRPGQVLVRGVGLLGCFAACSVYTPVLLDDADDDRNPFSNGGSSSGGKGGTGGFAGVIGPAGGAPQSGGTSGAGSGGTFGPGSGGTFVPGSGGSAGSAPSSGGSGGDVGGSGGTSAGGTGGSGAGTGGSGAGAGGSGAGAGGSSAGSGGMPVIDPCMDPLEGTEEPFDDFEDEDEWLNAAGGRNGTWYVFNDMTVGTQSPAPMTTPLPVAIPDADVGAPSSTRVMHMTATGFTTWGSGIGANLVTPKDFYDASAYQAITFWAKVGAGAYTKAKLVIPDMSTEPTGGKCNPAAAAPNAEKCNNHFFIEFTLTTSWRKCRVDFADLRQDPSWGYKAPALDAEGISSVQFTVKHAVTADLWLDDLAFVLK
jgi:hypothetical protein